MTSVLTGKKAGTARAGKGYYLTYTALFAVMCLFVFFWYFALGKSFIAEGDGWYQHYRALLYYGRALRSMLRSFLETGRLVFPHWDFALGEGADVVLNLHYYAVGDPLNLLTAFVPTSAMPVFYGALSLLRLYLSGLSFLVLCRQRKLESKWGVLAGALTYVFCCWGISMTGLYPYFLIPMVYLPMIFAGIEKIFAGERPYLLIVSVCLAACSNFYYFYMLVILSVIWAVIRALCMLARHELGWKALICTAAKVTGAAALGAAISAVLTLPLIHSFLQSPRGDASGSVWMLLYPPSHYSSIPAVFLGHGRTYDLIGGFSALSLLTALLLFRKKGNGELKAFLTVLMLFLLFPFFGKLMNGFAYVVNRWCWALSLGIALTVPVMWEQMLALKRKDAAYLTAAAGVLLALCLLLEYSRRTDAFAGVALMFLCLLVLLVWPDAGEQKQKALVLLTAVSVGVNAFLTSAPVEGGYQISEMVNLDYINAHIENNETHAVLEAAGVNCSPSRGQ